MRFSCVTVSKVSATNVEEVHPLACSLSCVNPELILFWTAPIVNSLRGDIVGVRKATEAGTKFLAFYGIPYAKPPTGELRFKVGWMGLRSARCIITMVSRESFDLALSSAAAGPAARRQVGGRVDGAPGGQHVPPAHDPGGTYKSLWLALARPLTRPFSTVKTAHVCYTESLQPRGPENGRPGQAAGRTAERAPLRAQAHDGHERGLPLPERVHTRGTQARRGLGRGTCP